MASAKTLEYYRALPYTRRSEPRMEDGERFWLAWIEELPGCKADGETQHEALLNLDSTFDELIAAKMAWDSPIPEPRTPGVAIVDAGAEVTARPLDLASTPAHDVSATRHRIPAESETANSREATLV